MGSTALVLLDGRCVAHHQERPACGCMPGLDLTGRPQSSADSDDDDSTHNVAYDTHGIAFQGNCVKKGAVAFRPSAPIHSAAAISANGANLGSRVV